MKQDVKQSDQFLEEENQIRKAQADPNAFRPLYERYYKTIFLFVMHRIGEKDLSADVTSQVFLKAMLNLEKYGFRGLPFSAWLYRIAVNECNDFFRKTKRERLVVLEESSAERLYEEMFNDDHLEEYKRALPQILQKLSVDELQIVELRFLEGRPFKEVAVIMGITETYAKVKTYRTLEKMKSLFIKRSV